MKRAVAGVVIKNQDILTLIDRCRELGAVVTRTGKGHLRLALPTGRVVFCGAHHDGDPRLHQNIRSQIRRAWPEKAESL